MPVEENYGSGHISALQYHSCKSAAGKKVIENEATVNEIDDDLDD